MFHRLWYIQLSDRRLRLSIHGSSIFFEDSPVVAISGEGQLRKIVAIGKAAEQLAGKPGHLIVRPFSNPRIAVDDYTVAEKLLQHAVRTMQGKMSLFQQLMPLAKIVIHPERQFDDGLTQIEARAFRELASTVGGRIVALHTGAALNPQQLAQYDFHHRS